MARLGQFRRDTYENWMAENPILADGEFFLVAMDSSKPREYNKYGCGDGTSTFSELKTYLFQEGGSGGTTNYNNLDNKPSINGITLSGNKTSEDLKLSASVSQATETVLGGIKAASKTANETVEAKIDSVTGKLFVPAGGMTTEQQNKLNSIESGANKTIVEQSVTTSTTNVPSSNAVKVGIDAAKSELNVDIENNASNISTLQTKVSALSGIDSPFVGYFDSSSKLPAQTTSAWALVGDLATAKPYAYYVAGNVPNGYSAGWNDLSGALGTYDFTDISKYDNHWKGRKWYAYGTSLTNTAAEGKYAKYLQELSETILTNKGISGGAIVNNTNIKSAVMDISDGKLEADLITLEVGANDTTAVIGDIYDTSDETFCGALNQCIRYLQSNTNAQIVVLSSTNARKNSNGNLATPETEYGSDNHTKFDQWEATRKVCQINSCYYIPMGESANMSYARMNASDLYNADNIHHTEIGGYNLAQFCWSILKNIPLWFTQLPNKNKYIVWTSDIGTYRYAYAIRSTKLYSIVDASSMAERYVGVVDVRKYNNKVMTLTACLGRSTNQTEDYVFFVNTEQLGYGSLLVDESGVLTAFQPVNADVNKIQSLSFIVPSNATYLVFTHYSSVILRSDCLVMFSEFDNNLNKFIQWMGWLGGIENDYFYINNNGKANFQTGDYPGERSLGILDVSNYIGKSLSMTYSQNKSNVQYYAAFTDEDDNVIDEWNNSDDNTFVNIYTLTETIKQIPENAKKLWFSHVMEDGTSINGFNGLIKIVI